MKAQKLRFILLTLLALVLLPAQNVRAFTTPLNLFQQTPATAFRPPLGYQNGVTFAPRLTYDNNNILIEDTNYGVKNPDLKKPDNTFTCFGVDWRTLYHAGEDLYNRDNPNSTVEGEIVTAVANGTVTDVSDLADINYLGRAITIYHELPGQDVWSVYIHLDTVSVEIGDPVSIGQPIGTVIHQNYGGWFPEYHSTDDSHLHFEIRYFPDARGIYAGYPACELGDVAGRGYTAPDIYPDNFPAPGAGYTDPSNFIASHVAPTVTPVSTSTYTPVATITPPILATSTPALGEGSWVQLGTWDVTCNTIINFPPVTATQFKFQMLQGGGDDNHISFYGLGSSGAAWLVNGSWQDVNYVTFALDVGEWRETNVFEPAVVSQQRFSVGCNDDEHMDASVYYRITYMPTPTAQPFPTFTLTPIPSCDCPIDYLDNECSGTASNNNPKDVFHTVSYSIQQALFDIQLLHRIEDEVLSQTPTGQYYIDLYYGHGFEIVELLRNNSALKDEAITTLQLWEPNLQELVNGNGNTVTIASGQVQAVQTFLDHLYVLGSAGLQQTIASERALIPLEQTIGKTMDQAWIHLNGFPSTSVLDNFNRANGLIGSNWSGYTSKYHVASNRMTVDYNGSNSHIYWNNLFGVDQEAYVTFTDIDASASEQDLLLKAQSNTTWGDGVLEVLYDPTSQRVQVWTYEWPDGWIQHGADIPVAFVDGDTFGARALANGMVEVYRNGDLLATRDITAWSHYAAGGYIGLWFIGAEDTVLDDFGGGTISGGMQSMMAGGSTESKNLTPAQLDVNVQDAVLYWQGIPIGSNQPAEITFTNVPTNKQSLLLKPQSNGVWGEGVVEVLYDVTGQRIQVWMYDAQTGNGWVQYGKDIPVKFAAGDKFSVRVLADGTVEIQRNGKPLAKRDVTP